jgi:hypothetical protein
VAEGRGRYREPKVRRVVRVWKVAWCKRRAWCVVSHQPAGRSSGNQAQHDLRLPAAALSSSSRDSAALSLVSSISAARRAPCEVLITSCSMLQGSLQSQDSEAQLGEEEDDAAQP